MDTRFLYPLLDSSPDQPWNLELPAEVLWHARKGMQWHQLDPKIMKLLEHCSPPNVKRIHLGSNDP